MAKRKTIFDSKSELKLFKELELKWNKGVKIFNHMPLANVIDFKKFAKWKDKDFLFRFNFDFVIASKEEHNYGEPILIIEFDGLTQGYSEDIKFIGTKEFSRDQYRKLKMNTKLEIADLAGIPLVVVSDFETNLFDENFNILDGIIGNVLSENEFSKRFDEESDILEERVSGITDHDEIQSLVDAYGVEREIESKMKYNPIYAEAKKLQQKLYDEKLSCFPKESEIIENGKTKITQSLIMNNGQVLSETIGIRNVNCKGAYSFVIASEIAELLLFRKVAKLYNLI